MVYIYIYGIYIIYLLGYIYIWDIYIWDIYIWDIYIYYIGIYIYIGYNSIILGVTGL